MNLEIVGKRIKERRLELGVTLQDIAEEIGVNKSTVLRYENGTIKDIKIPVIKSIAKFLNVNPQWLLGKEVNKTHSEEYERVTHIMNLNFGSVEAWSEDKIFSENETIIIREHFSDLLARYKQVLESLANAKLRWKNAEESYKKLYSDRLTDDEIQKLFFKNELGHSLESISNWTQELPNRIVEKKQSH